MKRLLILFGVIATTLFCHTPSEAQRMLVGDQLLSVMGGVNFYSTDYVKSNVLVDVDYGRYIKNSHYITVGVGYQYTDLQKVDYTIPTHQFLAKGLFHYRLVSDYSSTINLYAHAGLALGGEFVAVESPKLPDGTLLSKTNSFVYGGDIGTHVDYFFSNRFALTLSGGTAVLFDSLIELRAQPYIQLGVRLLF